MSFIIQQFARDWRSLAAQSPRTPDLQAEMDAAADALVSSANGDHGRMREAGLSEAEIAECIEAKDRRDRQHQVEITQEPDLKARAHEPLPYIERAEASKYEAIAPGVDWARAFREQYGAFDQEQVDRLSDYFEADIDVDKQKVWHDVVSEHDNFLLGKGRTLLHIALLANPAIRLREAEAAGFTALAELTKEEISGVDVSALLNHVSDEPSTWNRERLTSYADEIISKYILRSADNSEEATHTAQEPGLAIDRLQRAADLGDADALYALGTYYQTGGPGAEVDEAKALAYYDAAAAAGVIEARDTALNLRDRIIAREDEQVIDAASTVADLLALRDPITRFSMMDQAAEMEHLPDDDRKAATAHRLAAAQEIMASSRLRERARQAGIGERVYSLAPREENRTADEARERAFDYKGQQDHEYAIQFFREAAAAGDAESMYELGLYHELGVEVAQDLAEAGRLYQAAADGGFLEANNAIDALERRKPQEQAAQPVEEPESVQPNTKRPRETKEQWQARKAYEELNALPTAHLATIAAGRDRGEDHRLWAWRWAHVTVEMREALQKKLEAAGQRPAPAEKARQDQQKSRSAAPSREKPAARQEASPVAELGMIGPRDAAAMTAADRAAAYRSALGDRSAVDIQGDTVRVVLPTRQTIRDDGRNILVDRVDSATCTTTARTMMEMVKARGWTEVQLRGTREFKLALARAAVDLGLTVKNAELAADVARFKREQENTARMRPASQAQEQRQDRTPDRPADRRVEQLARADQVAPATAHQAIESYAGRSLDTVLTRGAEAAVATATGIDISFGEGAKLTHSDAEGAELAGHLTPDRARLMAELMAARGEASVTLSGSQHAKELMARAAVGAGLAVTNTEMRQLVEQLRRELAEARERQAQVAAMRPDRPASVERPQQPREASAAAMRELEIARLKRELAATESAIDRMRAADRLARAATDQALRQQAQETRLQAARQVLAEGHHDEMAEELVAEAGTESGDIQSHHQADEQER